MKFLRTLEMRLYPNKGQTAMMRMNLECCRFVFNKSLEFCINEWESSQRTQSFFDLCHNLTEMKEEHPMLREAYSQCLIEAVKRLTKAYAAFFRRVENGETPGFPRFKGIGRYDSFTYPNKSQYSMLDNRKLRLGKIGDVKYHGHVDDFIVNNGIPKTCTIKRSSTGKWFAYIVFEIDMEGNGAETFKPKEEVGIDLNIKNLATLSDGTTFPNNKYLEKDLDYIGKIQRKMSKHEKNTSEYKKYKRQLAHRHERIRNRRKDQMNKVSRYLVDNHKFIAFEDLNVQKIIDNTEWPPVKRAYYSVAWKELVTMTEYKAECAGIGLVKVNPKYTTQMCSKCGNIVPKTLDERVHRCDGCGLEIDRDLNAAINILNMGRGRRPLSSETGLHEFP